MQNKIKVFTIDGRVLDDCHVSRARMLVNSKKAEYVTTDKGRYLRLKKTSLELGLNKESR